MGIIGEDQLPEDVSELLDVAFDDGSRLAALVEVAAEVRVPELDEVVRRMCRAEAAKVRLASLPSARLRPALEARHRVLAARR